MAKINRYDGNLVAFGSGALGTERTVFGDVTQSDALDDNINPDFIRGWGIVGVNENPTKQDFNAIAYTATQLLAYLHQMGVAEWNTNQEYYVGSVVQHSGRIYISTANSNIGNDPSADGGVNWSGVSVEIISSISELESMTSLSGSVYLLGRNNLNDGGQGWFIFDGSKDYSAEVTADPNQGVYVAPSSSPLGIDGVWVRQHNGEYNPLWWRDSGSPNDLSIAVQNSVDFMVTVNAGQAGRRLRLPNRSTGVSSTVIIPEPWDWSTQVAVDDTILPTAKEPSFEIYGDPVWIKVTADMDSLFITGITDKSRNVSIHDLHIDVNGHTISQAIILRGDSLTAHDYNIEVADNAGGGSVPYFVKHDSALSAGWGSDALSNSRFHDFYMSGTTVVTNGMIYSNNAVNNTFRDILVGASCIYGIELVSSEGFIQSNTIDNIFSQAGIATNTALVRLEEAGNTISKNTVKNLYGNNLVTYGVSLARASGLIRQNVFQIMHDGWATSDFNIKTDDTNIINNSFIEDYTASFTGTATGMTTSPTGSIKYSVSNSVVTLNIPDILGTSNATTFTVTGMPAEIRPRETTQWMPIRITDNGVIGVGIVRINTSGDLDFKVNVGGGTFTGSGSKGVNGSVITFSLLRD